METSLHRPKNRRKMKSKVLIIASLLLSCSVMLQGQTSEEVPKQETLHKSFRDSKEQIEKKRKELAAVPDTLYNFVFTGDDVMKTADPHAYWLLNRMMQTVQEIRTAEDAYAWALMMEDCVFEYNRRSGRKIGSVNRAINDLDEFIDSGGFTGRREYGNTDTVWEKMLYNYYKPLFSYENSILAIYKTINLYMKPIAYLEEQAFVSSNTNMWSCFRLQDLYYMEFCEWFDLTNALNAIMEYYSYSMAHYRYAPMERTETFERWSCDRFEELKIEQQILGEDDWQYFDVSMSGVSKKEFDELIEYFKTRNRETVAEELEEGFAAPNREEMLKSIDENLDFEKVAEMVSLYETALNNWCKVRDAIAERQRDGSAGRKAYRDMTKRVYKRFYNDLSELKDLHW